MVINFNTYNFKLGILIKIKNIMKLDSQKEKFIELLKLKFKFLIHYHDKKIRKTKSTGRTKKTG